MYEQYSSSSGLWKPGRLTKVFAFVVGGLFALLSVTRPDGYGWIGATLMATIALVIPILQYRKLWNQGRFWMTVTLMAILQIPLISAVQPLVEHYRAIFLLAFGIGDGLLVLFVITSICSGGKSRDN